MARKKHKEEEPVNARIDPQPDGLFCIVNDDTGESMGTNFPTREAAEQSALDHDCSIVTQF